MGLETFRLDGRVAIVTGGSKGLGEAMATALAEAGSRVVIISRNLDESQQVASRITATTQQETLALRVDVTRDTDVEQMVSETMSRFGRIDVLVNNAGINIRKPMLEIEGREWESVIDVNLKGPMLCSRAVGNVMVRQRAGSVINLASMMSFVSISGRSAYSTSKAGLVGMTRALALEWAQYNVRVNALCPGPFVTSMNKALLENKETQDFFVSRIPLGRFGDPRELGGAVVFLAADASSFVTGSALLVDGGWTAQ
jgi:NAD(P)-dependent dehydrogenase (short-subunit alcohol dehydrogenase family)